MAKRNPIEQSRYINGRYKEYLSSSFSFGDSRLQELFEEQLGGEDLFKGPYLDMTLPFKRGKSISALVSEGVVCESFLKLSGIDFDRPLYMHQERSLRHVRRNRGAIVTTGTGSGKTEAFLYPILNEVLQEIEDGNRKPGVRALFLYPMNALVNDQIGRVREILRDFPDITFGFFTGDTPETASEAFRAEYAATCEAEIPQNELLSRKEIRSTPPHLLFTNYSMLEYLLIRPNDFAIFKPEMLGNWKFVVLDEAHSYSGSLGIELSYLMRRLIGLADKKPRFILSSATLGEEGKSENDIVEFAKKLTSYPFEVSDIIFSERIKFRPAATEVDFACDDYLELKSRAGAIVAAAERFGVASQGRSTEEILFELLSGDPRVARLYQALVGRSRSAKDIMKILDLGEAQGTALIDLINAAKRNGIELFSLKYHSFVRPLSGAYVAFTKPSALSLTKTNQIGGSKAFEIGNCRYCNSPYLIGKVVRNHEDELDYLLQNDEVDIYENYGENEYVNVDFFLMESIVDEEDVDPEQLDKCVVCSKCGAIREAENLKARSCECEGASGIVVYRVLRKDADEYLAKNNITKCPCCGRTRAAGVVKSLNLGKDESTAIIAQTLLESMDSTEASKKKKALSLSLNRTRQQKDEGAEEDGTKQFLAFSDSRSQASFFATFFNANHSRMLRKRLIWKVLEDNDYRVMPVEELEAKLEILIRNGDLFDNDLSPFKNAWITILTELLRIDGQNSCEGNGLYHFDLDLTPILEQFEDADVEEAFGQYGFSTCADLEAILRVVYYSFAVDYAAAGLSPEERQEYLSYRSNFDGVELKGQAQRKGVRSFLPLKAGENTTIRFVEKAFGCGPDDARQILEVLFNLGVDSGIFVKDASVGAYRIAAERYTLKNYKNTAYYRCSKCGRVTPYSVRGVCPTNKCDGRLDAIDPDIELSRSFYRQQYKTKKIERMVVEEHTAQLDKKTAKRYQNEFKNKRINVLSCSTTFEMGVDIGGLETVFMRNVPPTPANYVQRAGRAGRRKDSSAYVLTYCGATSHDYTYFVAPDKMICGVISPPYFDTMNRKILTRHLMASSLGFFFREKPAFYDSIDSLVFQGGVDAFKAYMMSKPADLIAYLDQKVIPEAEFASFHGLRWFEEMGGNDEKLQHFEDSFVQMQREYQMAQEEAKDSENFIDAKYFSDQIERLHRKRVIDALSEYCVIPKYGFPIDVVDLEIYEKGRRQRSYDLSRDLKIGISEYAPGSEVVVDKKKYTSRYVSIPRGSELPRRYFCKCPNCNKLNVMITEGSSGDCLYCGASIGSMKLDYFIEPIYGFKTGESKQSSFMKPKRSYSGEVDYLGGGIKDSRTLAVGDHLFVETTSNDELLIMNKSTFYFCKECGYGETIEGRIRVPSKKLKHKNHRAFQCANEELETVRIGHRFQTDVARITVPSLSLLDDEAFPQALSFMYAFLEGACEALEIERTDLNALLEVNLGEESYDILIYDDVPGGAGLVKRLMSKESIVATLEAAMRKVSQTCCDEGTSCYNCLRSYYNQGYHSLLKRRLARDFVAGLLPAVVQAKESWRVSEDS